MKRVRCRCKADFMIQRPAAVSWVLVAVLMAMLHLFLLMQPGQAGGAQLNTTPDLQTPRMNGPVHAIAHADGITYIGGNFTSVAPYTGVFAALSVATGQPILPYARVNGNIQAVVSDGVGGCYIGGEFTEVCGVARNRIAHILADGTLDRAWNPHATGAFLGEVEITTVKALAVSGSLVYVGGYFTHIGGQERHNLAAIDANGRATDWNPNANRVVNALAVSDGVVYAGGDFTQIGVGANVQSRHSLAAIDVATGTATAWNPHAAGAFLGEVEVTTVKALAVSGSLVYVGGYFTHIGGQERHNLAAIDANGRATDWNPNADRYVFTLAVGDGVVYAGGDFTQIGVGANVQSRRCLAAIDVATGTATAWNPNANREVFALAVSDGRLYVGGYFQGVGGLLQKYLAAIDVATGNVTTWNPNVHGGVLALAVADGKVYAGGVFRHIGGEERHNLAAMDARGNLTPWNPNADGNVYALTVSDGKVYVGGHFTHIGGRVRINIAAIDITTGTVIQWSPYAIGPIGQIDESYVAALSVSGSVVYVGGLFRWIGGQSRNNIACLNATTGLATSWNPDADRAVFALAVSNGKVYAGGYFTKIHGQERNYLAAIYADDGTPYAGTPTGWNPNADSSVFTLAVNHGKVYVGGAFNKIGGQMRNYLAAIDANGNPTRWDPNANERVNELTVSGWKVYVGGFFTRIGDQRRNHLAAIDANGRATRWNPDVNNVVDCLAVACGPTVYVGGYFTYIDGWNRLHFAKFRTPWNLSQWWTCGIRPQLSWKRVKEFFIRDQ